MNSHEFDGEPSPQQEVNFLRSVFNSRQDLDEIPQEEPQGSEIRQGEFMRVGLPQLNTVAQSRSEYSGIDILADNIKARRRLIHPILVSAYDRQGAQQYLDIAHKAFGDKIPLDQQKTVDDLTLSTFNGRDVYLIVISGHRRLRALKRLDENDSIVQIIEDEDPFDALETQASENTAVPPKDYERAESNGKLFAIRKVKDPKLSVKHFASEVAQTEYAVHRDLLYYNLPDSVKDFVVPRARIDTGDGDTIIPDQPLMPFPVACQLGRLVRAGASEHDIKFIARNFFKEGITSEETARKRVSGYIKDSIQRATNDLVDIFGFTAEDLRNAFRVKQLAETFASKADQTSFYWERLLILRELGYGDEEEDNLSFAAGASRLVHLSDVIDRLIPYLKTALEPDAIERIQRVFLQMRELSENVEERVGIGSEV